MAITLPIDLVVAPGSADAAIRKATGEAVRAAQKAAQEQARQLKYVDDLRRKYFLQEQKRQEQEVKDRIKAEGRKLQETEKSLKALAGAVGLVSQRASGWLSGAGEIVGAVDDMNPKTLAMAGAFTVAGLAVTAAAAAAAAFVAGAAAITAGIIGTVKAAEELVVTLKPLRGEEGFGASKSAIADITAANDAMASLGAVAKQLVVAMGAEFAPVVERVSVLLVKFGLMALDAFNALAQGGNVLRQLAEFLVNVLVQALAAPVDQMLRMVSTMADLAEAAGADGLAKSLKDVTAKWDDFKNGLATRAVNLAVEGFERLDVATGDYDARAKSLIATVGKMRTEVKGAALDLAAVQEAINKVMSAGVDGEMRAVDEQIANIKLIADELMALNIEKEWQALAEGTSNFVPRDVLKNLRTLSAQVDALIPADALTEVDKLNLLLLDMQLEASKSTKAAAALADPIERVTDRIKELRREKAGELFQSFAAGAQKAVGVVTGLGSALGAALKMTTGISVSDVIGATQEEGGGAAAINVMVDAAKAFIATLVAELPATLDALIAGIPGIIDGIVAAIPKVVATLIDVLPDLVDLLVSQVPRLLDALISALPGLIVSIIEQLPALIEGLVAQLPALIRGLLGAVAEIVMALITALPDIIFAIIDYLPQIISALVAGTAEIALALVTAIVYELLPALPSIVATLITALAESVVSLGVLLAAAVLDALGADKKANKLRKQVYGDTPGIVKWGDRGPADFAEDDWVAAARSRSELQRMTGGGQSSGPNVVDLADGHLAFDGQLRRATKQPRTRRELFGFTVARGLA